MGKYPCTKCGEGFPTEEALMAHVEDQHEEPKKRGAKIITFE